MVNKIETPKEIALERLRHHSKILPGSLSNPEFNIFRGCTGTGIFYRFENVWYMDSITHDPNMVRWAVSFLKGAFLLDEKDIYVREIVDSEIAIQKTLDSLNNNLLVNYNSSEVYMKLVELEKRVHNVFDEFIYALPVEKRKIRFELHTNRAPLILKITIRRFTEKNNMLFWKDNINPNYTEEQIKVVLNRMIFAMQNLIK